MSGPFGSPLGRDDSDVNEIKDAGLHHNIRSGVILSALMRQKMNQFIYFPFGFFCVLCAGDSAYLVKTFSFCL